LLIKHFENEHTSTIENFELLDKMNGSILLISCSLDKTIVIWSLSLGIKLLKLSDHNERIYALKLIQPPPLSQFQNELFLASASMDNVIKIWNVSDWRIIHSVNTSHTEGFFWSLDSIHQENDDMNEFILISGGLDGFIKTWKVSKKGFNFFKSINTGSSIWSLTTSKIRILKQLE
jgi:WD40 repeat protein